MKKNLKEKGITLVALVVTIIMLLILAGVTINLVLNNNGLLKKAQEASNMMANATKNEARAMDEMAYSIGGLANNEESYNYDKKVNPPVLKSGMTPVKFNEGNIIKTTKDDTEWYDYENRE